MKILSILAKNCSKFEIELFPSALFHTNTKVCLMYFGQDCRSIISLSKIAHQMWRDHLFRQRNKTKERAVGLGVGGPLPTKADFIVPRPKGPPGLMTTQNI